MKIRERIEKLRQDRGWTENYLAMEAGLTQSTLNTLINRDHSPRVDTLQKICEAFGITLEQFFSEEEKVQGLTEKENLLLSFYRKLDPKKQQALIDLLNK